MTNSEKWNIDHRYEMAMRNLNPVAWDKMTPDEKIDDLQAIEDKNAMEQGRVAAEVGAEPMGKNDWGYQLNNEIVINSNELNNPNYIENVDTVYHEGEHVKDWQAEFIPEVRSLYTQSELAERNSPEPDPDTDYAGYCNHPAEVAAREAGAAGVAKSLGDREYILEVDREMKDLNPTTNQILETYDYIALDTEIGSSPASAEYSPTAISSEWNHAENSYEFESESEAAYGTDIYDEADREFGIVSDMSDAEVDLAAEADANIDFSDHNDN